MAGNATLRMGYTRIEPFPGGRLAFAALEHDAKTGDGRGRTKAQGWIIAEAGAGEGLNRLCPSQKERERKGQPAYNAGGMDGGTIQKCAKDHTKTTKITLIFTKICIDTKFFVSLHSEFSANTFNDGVDYFFLYKK